MTKNEKLARGINRIREEDVIMVSEPDKQEWQCVECGTVVESKRRPPKCPHCNTVNGDLKAHLRVMIPREACGWFD